MISFEHEALVNYVAHPDVNSWWNSTLVIVWVSLGSLLLVAFIRWHRLRRKVVNIDSTPVNRPVIDY